MSREEDAYVIERMGKLLAEIAIIVNGAEPHDTLWSYHDLPEKVRALKQAQQPAALAVPEVEEKYAELLYAVESKCPGESRHETALRYIREREAGAVSTAAQSAMLAAANKENPCA